jgi:hypothetical protein
MCDDPVFDSAHAGAAPRQVAKIRQKKISLLDKTDMAHSHLAATVFRAKNQIY